MVGLLLFSLRRKLSGTLPPAAVGGGGRGRWGGGPGGVALLLLGEAPPSGSLQSF